MRAYERLINYTKYETASLSGSDTCPSTPSQLEFGKALVEEMKQLGIKDAAMDENGYVFGTIAANTPNWSGSVIGFISHMDVVRDVPYQNVKPRLVQNYDGGDILLNADKNIVLNPQEFDTLKKYVGCDLVVTDGTTLLGADDKAGLAEILTMAEKLQQNPEIKHGTIKIGFTPDEEIGRGADLFDVKRFGADFAYTVDGAAFGEVEYETFNAASAKVTIEGVNIHPGSAKDKMKNSMLIAMEFNSMLPENERPEHTEKYEGFFHLNSMEGNVDRTVLDYIIRDHDLEKLEQRKTLIEQITKKLNEKYGEDTVQLEMRDQYYNMAEKIKPHWHLIETAYEAVKELGGTPCSEPVRGGTDGSRLSFMELPCPNLGTGSHNHHGKMEYACVQAMDQCVELLIKIAEKYGQKKK
ncbi:MAG TPA: peptidase T [Lachnospiraceae bacterium]|jgi:tripeptide aminopeptidase|nr:peptidase T [Lachnospiraceae bacterium]HCM13916.1 peptidase T [Lachnospiraceae bacterium]HCR41031.1 peptidase T [Lachnospiraceae bacterium]